MAITTTNLKAAIEAKIAAATSGTSLEDLTVIKADADLYIRNTAASITGYSTLEGLIQTKENSLTGSSTLDDITLAGVAAFPPTASGSSSGGIFSTRSRVLGTIPAGVTGTILTLTPPADQVVRLLELFGSSSSQGGLSIQVNGSEVQATATIAGPTPSGSQFFVSDIYSSSSLGTGVYRIPALTGTEIKILKDAGTTTNALTYRVEYGVIL